MCPTTPRHGHPGKAVSWRSCGPRSLLPCPMLVTLCRKAAKTLETDGDNNTSILHGIAFAELVDYIEEIKANSTSSCLNYVICTKPNFRKLALKSQECPQQD